jgi:hypothetical protein
MANDPFNREIYNVRERPLSTDNNYMQTFSDRSLRDFIRALLAPTPSTVVTGFLNQSFKVIQSGPSMNVIIQPGLGFIDAAGDVPTVIGGVTGLDDPASLKPLPLSAAQTIAIDAAHATLDRIDIIEVNYDRRAQDPTSRDILNPATGVFAPGLVNKVLAWYLDGRTGRVVTPADSTTGIGYKVGVAAGSPSAPPTTAGYVKIAEIYVTAAHTSIVTGDITDTRPGSNLALLSADNIFTGDNTFNGNIVLAAAVLQSILKGNAGGLDIGTSIASDLRVLLNNVAQWTFRESDSALVTSGGAYLRSQSGNELEIRGAVAAAGGGNDVLIDTLVTRTAGWILRILNNGTPLYTFPSAGTPTQPTDVLRLGDKATPVISASSGSFSTNSVTYVDVTNLTVTIVTTGKPVIVTLIPDGSGAANIGPYCSVGNYPIYALVAILLDSSIISEAKIEIAPGAAYAGTLQNYAAPGCIHMISTPAAGSHTYKVQVHTASSDGVQVNNCKLVAYEI